MAAYATQSGLSTWYGTLEKPYFNPSNWLFASVGTVLYILMGIAAGLVWSRGVYHRWVKTALYHFGFQLLLNGLWFVVIFGFGQPSFGLLLIVALFILLLLTIKWFKLVTPIAAYLLIPNLIWVVFAMVLNFEIWRLN